jgi:hypothetical protein
VITPLAFDLQIPAGQTFFPKSETTNEANRSRVGWLDIRFDTVQTVLAKEPGNDLRESGAHEPAPLKRCERVVPEVRALKRTANDLTDSHVPDEVL